MSVRDDFEKAATRALTAEARVAELEALLRTAKDACDDWKRESFRATERVAELEQALRRIFTEYQIDSQAVAGMALGLWKDARQDNLVMGHVKACPGCEVCRDIQQAHEDYCPHSPPGMDPPADPSKCADCSSQEDNNGAG